MKLLRSSEELLDQKTINFAGIQLKAEATLKITEEGFFSCFADTKYNWQTVTTH